MRALIQRVEHAEVAIPEDGSCDMAAGGAAQTDALRKIGPGFVVLLGVGQDDTHADAQKLWGKILRMRIFADDSGRTNLSLADVGGQVMVVSQFTLYADCKRGNRPSFTGAGAPQMADELYGYFCELVRRDLGSVATGEFGAYMQVSLVNDGPFTIWLDTAVL